MKQSLCFQRVAIPLQYTRRCTAGRRWGRPDVGFSSPGCAPPCWVIARGQLCWLLSPLMEQPSPPLLLFESSSMLFTEMRSFLSCKRLLGGYSQSFWDLPWCWMLVEMLHSPLSRAGELHRAELHFGADVNATIHALHMCREQVTFSSEPFWGGGGGGLLTSFRRKGDTVIPPLTPSGCLSLLC